MTVEDAKWIYDNCKTGTQVTFLNDSDVGPLGKPTSMKISNSPNRGWDPTDIDSKNPWNQQLDSPALNVSFNYRYYANKYPDLKSAFGYNEVLLKSHWLSSGIMEGRQASPVFDVKYYTDNNQDLKNVFGADYYLIYNHYLTYGYNEDRRTSPEFYVTFYKGFYTDLNYMSNIEAATHYINFGIIENRLGTISIDIEKAVFDSTYYADNYSDLKSIFGYNETNLRTHWFTNGIKEGREASPSFNVVEYKNYNKDLEAAFGSNNIKNFEHFVRFGINENRKTSKKFNLLIYKNRYNDLQNAFGNNNAAYFEHYNTYGIKENRNAL